MSAALTAGHPVVLDQVDTMADGLAAKTVSELTLAHTQALADVVVTVTEEEISQALLLLLERAKAVVEPAGATALAAVMAAKVGGRADAPVCVVLSGGNIDPLVLMRVIRYGLSAAGRYLLLRVVLHDRPGELHRLLGRVAAMGLNVLGVEHHRAGVHLPIDLVEVQLTLETRDPAHRDDVIAALRDDGYEVDAG